MHEYEENDVDGGLESGQALDRAHRRRRGFADSRWVATNEQGRILCFAGFLDVAAPDAAMVLALRELKVGKRPEKIQCVHNGAGLRYACIALPDDYDLPEHFIISGIEYGFVAYALELEISGEILDFIAHVMPTPTHKKAVTVELT